MTKPQTEELGSAGMRLGGSERRQFDTEGQPIDETDEPRLRFSRLDANYYQVFWGSLVLGEVYRDGGDTVWSYARWMIAGDRNYSEAGGVNGATTKKAGYVTRASAAHALSVIRSADILAYVNSIESQPETKEKQ